MIDLIVMINAAIPDCGVMHNDDNVIITLSNKKIYKITDTHLPYENKDDTQYEYFMNSVLF